MQPLPLKQIHPLWLRCCHWINAVTVAGMICSGWRIYNASPLFSFNYPAALTLGGWLGGALLWHFALMWILLINATIYLTLGICSGRFRSKFFPLSWTSLKNPLRRHCMESCIIRICRNTIWCKSRLYSDYFRWRCSSIVWSGFMETRSVFPSDYTIRWL